MAYDQNDQKNKNRGNSGHGTGVKKYPADKNFGGKPSGSRSFESKPHGDKPHGDKPYGDKPYGDRPHSDRQYDKKPYGEKQYGNKPHGDKPYSDRPHGGKPYNDKPEGARSRRPDWHKDYDKIPPRDEPVKRAPAFDESDDDEDDDSQGDGTDGLVIGRNAVRELLKSGRTIDKLLTQRGERQGSIVALVAEAVNAGIPIVEVDKAKLDELSGFVPHQGIIAMVAQKEYVDVEDILAIAKERGEAPLIVIADGITDPYNLGALIRCAEGVGAHGLIIPRRRAVGLTALVAKSSAGAMEHLAVAKVSNIAQTIKELKEQGIWCFAAEAGGAAHYDTDMTGPCALVFGSEGDGVSRIVKETCDAVISIPMYGKVNSFNVSTAAAVILCEAARQHHK